LLCLTSHPFFSSFLFTDFSALKRALRSVWERCKMGYADIYELLGCVNFHEVCRAMGVRWRSFIRALRAKKGSQV
jgi:hypothetical protein